MYLAAEKSKKNRCYNITCAEAGEQEGFGYGLRPLQDDRQKFFHLRIIRDYWISLRTEFERELLC